PPVRVDGQGPGTQYLPAGDLPLGPVAQLVGDAGLAAAVTVLVPGFGQEQLGVDQRLVAALGDAEVDGDDAVLLLATLAAPLALHARGLGPLLGSAGLVDQAHGAQAIADDLGEGRGDMLDQGIAGQAVAPGV